MIKAEYIWVDGAAPTKTLRSKTKVFFRKDTDVRKLPDWGFDGSSTYQSEGHDSDLPLKPVYVCPDPIRGGNDVLVLCEVMNPDGTPHATNTRAALREIVGRHKDAGVWIGIEQEYFMMRHGRPLGWPTDGSDPLPQGQYYCSVGADRAFGRPLAERHLDLCLRAGLLACGTNAEVAIGQWEIQIGVTDDPDLVADPLRVADELLIARWLLHRAGEDMDIVVSFEPKPIEGSEWNGSGGHTNFSTAAMRAEDGIVEIEAAIAKLGARHAEHIAKYGHGIEKRCTGDNETASHTNFVAPRKPGARNASVRYPLHVWEARRGYCEDRRPCANVDPYLVAYLLVETILET